MGCGSPLFLTLLRTVSYYHISSCAVAGLGGAHPSYYLACDREVYMQKISVQHLHTVYSSTWLAVDSVLGCCIVEMERTVPCTVLPGQAHRVGCHTCQHISPIVSCLLLEKDLYLGLPESLTLCAPIVLWCLWLLWDLWEACAGCWPRTVPHGLTLGCGSVLSRTRPYRHRALAVRRGCGKRSNRLYWQSVAIVSLYG